MHQRRFCYLFVVMTIMLGWTGRVLTQDLVRKADPPIVKIHLSGVEPLPEGVAMLMGFGSAGGGELVWDQDDNPKWRYLPPLIVYPQIPEPGWNGFYSGSTFVACGYSNNPPDVELKTPSGERNKIVVELDYRGCWVYYQSWSYGMELGEYSLTAKHPAGTLTHTWEVEYPPFQVIGLINERFDDKTQTRLLMGFAPGELLTLRIYSLQIEPEHIPYEMLGGFVGGYVASRMVEANEDGAVILDFSTTPSAPFSVWGIGFTIDGYQNLIYKWISSSSSQEYRVVRDATTNQVAPAFSVRADYELSPLISTIWKGLKFEDMTLPGTANYETVLRHSNYLLGIRWCADTPERLKEILVSLELAISVNDTPITGWDMIRYDEGSCRKWNAILTPNAPKLQIKFHYALSKDIFDGTNTYAAGDYYHIIDATFN